MSERQKRRIAVLGGGVTGLVAAYRLVQRGYTVVLIEKEDDVGGLARTRNKGEYHLDFGPHFLTSENTDIINELTGFFLEGELMNFERKAKIFLQDRYLDYPLTARNVLMHMGIKNAAHSAASYAAAFIAGRIRTASNDHNCFKTWAIKNFGHHLYNIFFKPYTEQFWKMPCEKMSMDCVPLVTKMSYLKTLKMLFSKRFSKKSLSLVERETTLPLFYPKKGIGALSIKLKQCIEDGGGQIFTGSSVTGLDTSEKKYRVDFCKNGTEESIEVDQVISTIPITHLVAALRPEPPQDIRSSASALSYLSLIVVYIAFKKRPVMDCSYLYLLDRPYNRITNTNAYCPHTSPDDENMLGLEITCNAEDSIWKMSDKDLFHMCMEHLEKDGFLKPPEVTNYFVIRAPNAYPKYKLGYKENLQRVELYLAEIPNLKVTGRTGSFKYMDIDQCFGEVGDLTEEFYPPILGVD